jgi:hypothetical protein
MFGNAAPQTNSGSSLFGGPPATTSSNAPSFSFGGGSTENKAAAPR